MSLSNNQINQFIAGNLSSDFNCISVIGTSKNENERFLIIFNTFLLAERKNELQSIANESFHISVLMQQCKSFLSKMRENWSAAMNSFNSSFKIYNNHLQDEGVDSSINEDLIVLLATGISCPTLDRFLCNTLKISVCILTC